jgi:hypothetical protein
MLPVFVEGGPGRSHGASTALDTIRRRKPSVTLPAGALQSSDTLQQMPSNSFTEVVAHGTHHNASCAARSAARSCSQALVASLPQTIPEEAEGQILSSFELLEDGNTDAIWQERRRQKHMSSLQDSLDRVMCTGQFSSVEL